MARNDDARLAEAHQKLDDAIREAEKADQESHADHAAKKEAVEKQREHFPPRLSALSARRWWLPRTARALSTASPTSIRRTPAITSWAPPRDTPSRCSRTSSYPFANTHTRVTHTTAPTT